MQTENKDNFSFDLPKNKSNVIKVIGVGGGGSNAINYMFRQGIKGVDFVVSNTDAQALSESAVPIKIQLGATLTEGLGAGANPEIGASAAKESVDDLQTLLTTQTKMVFITAGMGGGTGTGAAPIIAQMAKDLDILTVGIVTMPFQFEGKLRMDQAQIGLDNMKQAVDSLIVINNNKLREVYGNLGFKAGFAKADEVLATAARGIAEVITHHYTQNIDLKDAKTVLTNSGTAIMGSGDASGANRAQDAIEKALDSPLLNDNKITGCRNVLLLIVSGSEEITIDEIGEINDFIQGEAGNNANIIMGVGEDETLGSSISVTIIATGFAADQQHEIVNAEAKKIIHNLEDEQKMEHQLLDVEAANEVEPVFVPKPQVESEPVVVHRLEEMEDETEITTGVQDILEETVTDTSLPIEETDTEELDEEALRNLDVVYELIQPSVPANIETAEALETIEAEEEKFVFNDIEDEVREIEVVAPELILPEENQFSLDFEMSLDTVKSETTATVDKESSKEESIVKYDLEAAQIPDTVHENEEIFQVSEKESISETPEVVSDTNPFEQTITASVRRENEKRKEQLKQFNYAFKNNIHHIEEMERQPAYKRQGVDLDDTAASTRSSRITLDTDSNDQIQLRSNNSFLHDNVD
ncbi:MAG: cell division protein FtsZ [Flavobacteriaceae bacterium]